MQYVVTKSIDNPRLWLVKNKMTDKIVKYAYSEEEANQWIKEK